MRFEAEHDFPGSCAAVAAVLCDPDFQAQLALPDLSLPTVVSRTDDGPTRELTLRYEYVGQLDPIARKVIGGRDLTWIQALRLDTTTYRARSPSRRRPRRTVSTAAPTSCWSPTATLAVTGGSRAICTCACRWWAAPRNGESCRAC